jgi:hypothetical protein
MAYSYTEAVADGNTYVFAVGVPYINKEHIHVYEDDVETMAYTWLTDSTIQFVTKPTSGAVVKVQRITPKDRRIVTFQDPSVLKQSTLNLNSNNLFYIFQELKDQLDDTFAALAVLDSVIQLGPASLGSNDFIGNQSIAGDLTMDGGIDMQGNTIGDAILQGVTLQNYSESGTDLGSQSGALAIPVDQYQTVCVTVSGDITFSITGVTGAHSIVLILTAGGDHVVTWPTNIKWPEGAEPSLSSATDIVTLLTVDGGSTWYGVLAMDNLSLPA